MTRTPQQHRAKIGCVATLALLLIAACGGGSPKGDSTNSTSSPDGSVPDMSAQCPLDGTTTDGTGPTEITYWHAMTRANEETLAALTDDFNASQDDVEVSLVNQNGLYHS